jgi:hypothetical protein
VAIWPLRSPDGPACGNVVVPDRRTEPSITWMPSARAAGTSWPRVRSGLGSAGWDVGGRDVAGWEAAGASCTIGTKTGGGGKFNARSPMPK